MPLKNSTPINPAAMRIDYSPMVRAQQAKSAGLMALSGAVKNGVAKAQEKRKKKAANEQTAKAVGAFLSANPNVKKSLEASGLDEAAISASVDPNEILAVATQMKDYQMKQREQESMSAQRAAQAAKYSKETSLMDAKLKLEMEQTAADIAYKKLMGKSQSGPPELSESEAKIQRVMAANPTATRQEVVNALSGVNALSQDTITGEVTNVNKLKNTSSPISPTQQPQAPQPEAPGRTLWDRTKSTGAINAAKGVAQNLSGQLGINIADPEVQKDITAFDLASKGLIQVLALNKRYPVSEMNEIKKKISIRADAWTDEQSLQANLQALDEWATKEMKKAIADSKNRRLDGKTRQQAEADVIAFQNYLGELGVPQEGAAPSKIKFLGFE